MAEAIGCDSCGHAEAAGINERGRHVCAACAYLDTNPVGGGEWNDVSHELFNALACTNNRNNTIEQARSDLWLLLEREQKGSVANYNTFAARLIVMVNEMHQGYDRTVVVGHRHVNATAAAKSLKDLYDLGRGDQASEVPAVVEQVMRALCYVFGDYAARALFKEIVRPFSGEYAGDGLPGVFHSIKSEAPVGFRLPGALNTTRDYSTSSMAKDILAQLAQTVEDGMGGSGASYRLVDGKKQLFGQYLQSTGELVYPNKLRDAGLEKQWMMFVDLFEAACKSTPVSKVRAPRTKLTEREAHQAFVRAFKSDRSRPNYNAFMSQVWAMFNYYRTHVSSTKARKVGQEESSVLTTLRAHIQNLYLEVLKGVMMLEGVAATFVVQDVFNAIVDALRAVGKRAQADDSGSSTSGSESS